MFLHTAKGRFCTLMGWLMCLPLHSWFYYLTALAVGDPRGANYVRTSHDLSPLVMSSNKIVKARISSRFHYFITSKGFPIFDVRLSHPAGHELYPCYLRLLLHTSKEPLRVSTSFVGNLI